MHDLPRSLVLALVASLLLSAAAAAKPPAAPAWPLPLATPESQGLSSERLERLHAGVQRFVDEGRHAGAISLVARHGRIVDFFSTTGDYARFMQMLLNGGELDGVRVLSPKTVELMMANHLTFATRPFRDDPSEGFGLGGAVRTDLARDGGLGSVGQFGWTGMATTYASLDPKEKTVALLFVQHLPYDEHKVFWRFSTLFYQAIVDAAKE